MTDPVKPTPQQNRGCAVALLVVVALLVIGGGMRLWDIAFGGDGHISDDTAIERVDDAYRDCLDSIGLSTIDATVVKVDDPNPKGRYLSRVVLSDGAEFTVNALPTGAAPTNDQALSDLDAAGC